MSLLSGELWVYAKSYLTAGSKGLLPKFFQLREGIENDMAAAAKDLVEFAFTVSGRENVIFLAHFLSPKPRLEKSAASCSAEKLSDERVKVIAGEGLLCQEYPSACPLLNTIQNSQIFDQLFLIYDIAWSLDLSSIEQNQHLFA